MKSNSNRIITVRVSDETYERLYTLAKLNKMTISKMGRLLFEDVTHARRAYFNEKNKD